MIYQTALYRNIPKLRAEVKGFMEETQVRMTDATIDLERAARAFRAGAKHPLRESQAERQARAIIAKYSHRLKRSEQALVALTDLDRCLDE